MCGRHPQGRVQHPLLLNLVIDSVADAVRAICPGASLGSGPEDPRVAILLYADDIVILAESAADLQRALDTVSAWARR